tara:strand:- start:61 stop:606 length:546 start_codon:yes stop_codon:yes gene_type:complete
MSAVMAMPTVFAKTNYIEDFGDYLDRSATRVATQGPIGFLGKLFTGKLNTFSRFKNALKTTVHSVLQTVKEATAWATVGLSIANERLGKLAWAMLPQSFRDPLPKIVKEHMDSTLGKLLDELRDQVNPLAETPKEDMRRKVHLRRAIRDWRNARQEQNFDEIKKWDTKAPQPLAGLRIGPA